MNTPENPFRRMYQELNTHLQRLNEKVHDYDVHWQEYQAVREQLSAGERRACEVLLADVADELVRWQQEFETHYTKFYTLCQDIYDRHLQKDIEGLNTELQQLWQQYRQS